MATNFYKYPPRPSSGAGTFSDNIVGFQVVDGGGLTQGNFAFTTSLTEKVNRTFSIGAFSKPITLDNLQISSIEETKRIVNKEFGVYPNFDLTNVTKFSIYGPLTKRFAASVTQIINYFPAALEVYQYSEDISSGYTALNVQYDNEDNITTFSIALTRTRNPFGIDFTVNSTRNMEVKEMAVSYLRNMTVQYSKYALMVNDDEYQVINIVPTNTLSSGYLTLTVSGQPFTGNVTTIVDTLIIKPNGYYTEVAFTEPFDEIERYLLNRLVVPKYSAIFQVPKQNDDGTIFIDNESATWPLDGTWNLDIRTQKFTNYINQLNEIATNFDAAKTNLITRFLVTDAFKEFDTTDQKVQKVLSIYGRSFDEVKKFIDALAFMNSVNYNTKNDVPSALLKNLSQTLGWNINVSPITEEDFLQSIFGNGTKSPFPGMSRSLTPSEINFQFYKNLILNSAWLFKSKGTRKSIEFLLRLIGAPEAMIEFNETIYLADQKINMRNFNTQWAEISGGTYVEEVTIFDSSNVFSIYGQPYSGFTTEFKITNVDTVEEDYPVDSEGYPKAPRDTESFFFQLGAGWYELTPPHTSPQDVSKDSSVFTGQNPNIQTEFQKFTYGQKYLDRFRKFPYMNEGFKLLKVYDNKKSWSIQNNKMRISNTGGFNAYYYAQDDRLVLNVKNIDVFMNPAKGLVYDVWEMSKKYGFPIPNTSPVTLRKLKSTKFGNSVSVPPNKQSFFEFASTFWQNRINASNRQTASGYDDLASIYWNYLQSGTAINVPNNNFTYQTLINYVNNLGQYWTKLIEQMIPASTIWNGGIKYENAPFQRQKYIYKIPRNCNVDVPNVLCKPCLIEGNLFLQGGCEQIVTFPLFPWTNGNTSYVSFQSLLNQISGEYINEKITQGLTCDQNSIQTNWSMVVVLNGTNVINESFYVGYGNSDTPTNNLWVDTLESNLPTLLSYGFTYEIENGNIIIKYLGFNPLTNTTNIEIKLNVDYSIICN